MIRMLLRGFALLLVLALVIPLVVSLPPVGVAAETLADPDGYFVTIDGLQTYVLEHGPEDGVPVLLLHGWGASTFSWRENLDALAQAGYRAVAFDRPPYGLSQKTGDLPGTPPAQADFTVRLMDELDIHQAVLVGNSAGGAVAGYVAVRHPQRTAGVVFVGAALRPADDGAPVDGGRRLTPVMGTVLSFPPAAWWARLAVRALVRPDFTGGILRSAYYDPDFMTPEIEAGYARQLQVVGWDEALLNQFRGPAIDSEPLTADEIAAIDVPVLIVWGAEDAWIPVEVGERLAALLPKATFVTYPQTGHLPMEEAADAFNRDLLAFLAQLP
jgi:pimeloyl-ACP methyl ester carboxylesterase